MTSTDDNYYHLSTAIALFFLSLHYKGAAAGQLFVLPIEIHDIFCNPAPYGNNLWLQYRMGATRMDSAITFSLVFPSP
jgi:hypothetical protein